MTASEPDSANRIPDFPAAGLWRRLAALFYDCFLMVAIIMAWSALHLLIKVWIYGAELVETSPTAGGDPLLLAGALVCCWAFYCFFWIRNGQTLGMQSWRIRVQNEDGSNINLKQALTRLAVAPFSLLLVWGYLKLLAGTKTWHDSASNSVVVLIPKKK